LFALEWLRKIRDIRWIDTIHPQSGSLPGFSLNAA